MIQVDQPELTFSDLAIPGAQFELLADTGHLPQLESPQELLDVIRAFAPSAA
jgi:pimeloyl-ACP methyl ester carboxylesterase